MTSWLLRHNCLGYTRQWLDYYVITELDLLANDLITVLDLLANDLITFLDLIVDDWVITI